MFNLFNYVRITSRSFGTNPFRRCKSEPTGFMPGFFINTACYSFVSIHTISKLHFITAFTTFIMDTVSISMSRYIVNPYSFLIAYQKLCNRQSFLSLHIQWLLFPLKKQHIFQLFYPIYQLL